MSSVANPLLLRNCATWLLRTLNRLPASQPTRVSAVVSRGGRPDLAGEMLSAVRAPTLLIVGGADSQVLRLNEMAMSRIPAKTQLVIIPGATHLFEETGTLELVAQHTADWFRLRIGGDLST